MFSSDLLARAESLLADFRARRLTLATAESCTGGLIAALLSEIPGASEVLERGFVTYSNAAKVELLGVPADLIQSAGAVSPEVALAMAHGALKHAPADIAIAVTGIAGPGGGTADKPVGLVYLAALRRGSVARVTACRFGDIGRHGIRMAAVAEAVSLVAESAA